MSQLSLGVGKENTLITSTFVADFALSDVKVDALQTVTLTLDTEVLVG